MTRQQAIDKYLMKQVHSAETIRRLINWDTNITVKKNSFELNVTFHQAKYIYRHYRLKNIFRKINREDAMKLYLEKNICSVETINRIMLWNYKLTIRDNANKLNISYDTARLFSWYYKLNSRRIGQGNNYNGMKHSIIKNYHPLA